jgi:hypothetical protein
MKLRQFIAAILFVFVVVYPLSIGPVIWLGAKGYWIMKSSTFDAIYGWLVTDLGPVSQLIYRWELLWIPPDVHL